MAARNLFFKSIQIHLSIICCHATINGTTTPRWNNTISGLALIKTKHLTSHHAYLSLSFFEYTLSSFPIYPYTFNPDIQNNNVFPRPLPPMVHLPLPNRRNRHDDNETG